MSLYTTILPAAAEDPWRPRFLFSSVREWLKALIVALPFVGTLVDIGGMWLTRFVSPALAGLVIAGGTLFAVGYTLITVVALWELWAPGKVRS